jgi:hypothetical protein
MLQLGKNVAKRIKHGSQHLSCVHLILYQYYGYYNIQ